MPTYNITDKGYKVYDQDHEDAWVRIFCAEIADGSCGLLFFQHNHTPFNQYFDHKTEGNLSLSTGGTLAQAINNHNNQRADVVLYPVMRRLVRLLQYSDLNKELQDTITQRGLERLVAYAANETTVVDNRYRVLSDLGWRREGRHGKVVYVLDWDA